MGELLVRWIVYRLIMLGMIIAVLIGGIGWLAVYMFRHIHWQ